MPGTLDIAMQLTVLGYSGQGLTLSINSKYSTENDKNP